MKEQQSAIPLETQLQAICEPRLLDAYDLLKQFAPDLQIWNPKIGEIEGFKNYAKAYFTFSANELLTYLKAKPETCKSLLLNSYDKRSTPSSFIQEWENKQFRVGWVQSAGDPLIGQIHVFSSFAEAVADYVLFSWGFPRLSHELASWYEMDHN